MRRFQGEKDVKRRGRPPGMRVKEISGFICGRPRPRSRDDIWAEFILSKPGTERSLMLLAEYRAAGETITDEEDE